jgi:hypothetical protein
LGAWVSEDIALKDKGGKLDAGAIDLKRIPGFSTNKIPKSKKRDLYIRIKKEFEDRYLSEWLGKVDGKYPAEGEYEFLATRQLYFIRIGDFNNLSGEYQHPNDKNKKCSFQLKVVHKPLMANYWHFEFHVNSTHGAILKTKADWQKVICAAIRGQVQEKAVFEI